MTLVINKFKHYAYLTRFDKPIGILLLLWPTAWALWLATAGHPSWKISIIFILGVILMRAAGCAMNDFADRHIDGAVTRTAKRLLVTGQIKPQEALLVAAVLAGVAFLLVLQCNWLTIFLAVVGAVLATLYPFLKRVTHLPQLGLGFAFSWGVPMAFAAELNTVPLKAWFLFFTCALWPVIYDTMYAMVDYVDDKKIGVKSTAILFGEYNLFFIALLQMIWVVMLIINGYLFKLNSLYDAAILIVILLFIYQQCLLNTNNTKQFFAAFMHNHWVGLTIFLGILLGSI